MCRLRKGEHLKAPKDKFDQGGGGGKRRALEKEFGNKKKSKWITVSSTDFVTNFTFQLVRKGELKKKN